MSESKADDKKDEKAEKPAAATKKAAAKSKETEEEAVRDPQNIPAETAFEQHLAEQEEVEYVHPEVDEDAPHVTLPATEAPGAN